MSIEHVERVETVPALPPRGRTAHKGTMGTVMVVGGAPGMIGAPALTSLSALRGGAGLVMMALPASIQPFAAVLCPCATSVRLPVDDAGDLSPAAPAAVADAAGRADVLAVGPGMGRGDVQQAVVRTVLGGEPPIVLDADGLNNLSALDDWPSVAGGPLVLTPHPGEMSRLTGAPIKVIQSDRERAAVEAARGWQAGRSDDAPLVCVLKGAGTVVTDGRRLYVNTTGNPGMATGGTGDVLTGLIAALIGQGLEPFDAAVLGVYLHGDAGDAVASRLCDVSLIATDLVDELPHAFRRHASPSR
ncbi:MAG: NAD(P)H-hydrate dehydratase [Planctomycetota bacterium]